MRNPRKKAAKRHQAVASDSASDEGSALMKPSAPASPAAAVPSAPAPALFRAGMVVSPNDQIHFHLEGSVHNGEKLRLKLSKLWAWFLWLGSLIAALVWYGHR